MKETYSNGINASVFRLSPQEKLWFSTADLVRESTTGDRVWFARLYYRHKIASLLFPQNFITVVGASVEPHEQNLYDDFTPGNTNWHEPVERTNRLYSRIAEVNPDHATYSAHVGPTESENSIRKVPTCSCEVCNRHSQEHKRLGMEDMAYEFALTLEGIGIDLDCEDSTDYCLANGNIVFFEIDNFRGPALATHLLRIKSPTPAEQEALVFLGRHYELHLISKQEMLGGQARSLRLN